MNAPRKALAALTAILAVAAAGCTGDAERPAATAPALPEIAVEAFPDKIRQEVRTLLEAVRAEPENAALNGRMGMLLQAHDQYQTAEVFYRRADAFEPKTLSWPYYLGIVQTRQGKNAEAAQSFRRAFEADPSFEPARIRLALVLFEEGEIEQAGALYDAALKAEPDDAEARYGMGRVEAALGESEEAIGHLRRAVQLAPNFGAAHYELALAYRDAGRAEDSRRQLELYERDKTGGPPPRDPLIAAVNQFKRGAADYLKRGVDLEQRGDIEGAIAQHLKAIETDPDFEQAHANLVILYGGTGRFDLAERHYREALRLNPNQAELHYNFGVMCFDQQRYEEARRAFADALEVNPRYAAAHNNLGQMYEMDGLIDEAIRHYRAAVAERPDYRLARFHLGRMLMAKNRNREAVEQLSRTLTPEDERTPRFLFALATAYARGGDAAQAKRYAESAAKLARNYSQQELAQRIEQEMSKLP